MNLSRHAAHDIGIGAGGGLGHLDLDGTDPLEPLGQAAHQDQGPFLLQDQGREVDREKRQGQGDQGGRRFDQTLEQGLGDLVDDTE